MSNLLHAIVIATEAHAGQTDKAGAEYIGHPLRVMEMGVSEAEQIVGVLHDVVEDSSWTFEDLEKEGFAPEILDALRCVTKLSGEDYAHFIDRVLTNPLAIRVKMNDLRDNMDLSRLKEITPKDLERLEKYRRAYDRLEEHLSKESSPEV